MIEQHDPDIIGLQETKVADESFPLLDVEALGYHAEFFGQKTHYGVAILSKQRPVSVQRGLVDEDGDAQRRFLAGTYRVGGSEVTVINGYFPQGQGRKSTIKFKEKESFYNKVLKYLNQYHDNEGNVVVMGDMNVAPLDVDIGIGEDNRRRWLRDGKSGFLPEEREWLDALSHWGLIDSFRALNPVSEGAYSWFDYRSRGFEREPRRGLRIDLIMVSRGLEAAMTDAGIDHGIRAMERPSDHCPIWLELGP